MNLALLLCSSLVSNLVTLLLDKKLDIISICKMRWTESSDFGLSLIHISEPTAMTYILLLLLRLYSQGALLSLVASCAPASTKS